MDHHLQAWPPGGPGPPYARVHQPGEAPEVRGFPVGEQHAAADLIPNLHHVRHGPALFQGEEGVPGEPEHGLLQLLLRKALPVLRLALLGRVGPIIGIMEIQQKIQPSLFDFPAHLQRAGKAAVAAGLRHMLRAVPQPQAHGVHPALLRQLQRVPGRAVKVPQDHALLLALLQEGKVHPLIKIEQFSHR